MSLKRRPAAARDDIIGRNGERTARVNDDDVGKIAFPQVAATPDSEKFSRGMCHFFDDFCARKMSARGEFKHGLKGELY